MADTELWLEEWLEGNGQITVAAAIEQPGEPRRRLWYRVPTQWRDALTHSADPFVAGVLFDAMHVKGKLIIHGDVSPSLLHNIDEFQRAWNKWRPELYKPAEIVPDRLCEASPPETSAAVMTFSGGVDSCFTAWRHHARLAGPQQCDLRAGILVHGFDIPLNLQADYDSAAEQARQMLATIDMECIPMATNFRELKGHWEDIHGAGLASCLMLVQGGFRRGLIASSFAYSYLVLPYGSNPMTDGMFSSATFPVIHDGAGFARLEKTRAVAQWPALPQYLRVCWKGPNYDRNCGRCQKCVSTSLHFRLVGLPDMECFGPGITDHQLVWMSYPTIEEIKSMLRTIQMAKDLNVTDSWVGALRRSVLMNRLRMVTPKPLRALCRTLRGAGRRTE
ncbi:MAG: hypothetical protein ACYTAS_06160 [Planctomycetota bacterium]|jgi:hypothetical protein